MSSPHCLLPAGTRVRVVEWGRIGRVYPTILKGHLRVFLDKNYIGMTEWYGLVKNVVVDTSRG